MYANYWFILFIFKRYVFFKLFVLLYLSAYRILSETKPEVTNLTPIPILKRYGEKIQTCRVNSSLLFKLRFVCRGSIASLPQNIYLFYFWKDIFEPNHHNPYLIRVTSSKTCMCSYCLWSASFFLRFMLQIPSHIAI